ncbi:MAG: hypothetical protein R3Y09_11710 [Clostridia bacterium]
MLSPKRDLRILKDGVFEKEVERIAKACKQIYLHINNKFPRLYNPFSKQCAIEKDNIFGIVVVRDDPHINLGHIYSKTAELLNLEESSQEFSWLCRHVGVVSIYQIEKYCFTQSDMVSAIFENNRTGRINDFWLSKSLDKTLVTNKKLLAFNDYKDKQVELLIEECRGICIV